MCDFPCSHFKQEILHYLKHIKDVWHQLLHKDKAALHRINQATVKALELWASRYSRRDAQLLYRQLLSGQIFGAFSRQEHEEIWDELHFIDSLIPFLFTFFEDLKYLSICADCMKWLVKLLQRDTIAIALQRKFSHTNGAHDQCILEIAESTFVDRIGAATDSFDLEYRQL